MAKRYKNLAGEVVAIDNLRNAYNKTSKGKRYTSGYLEFKEFSEANLKLLQEELLSGSYKLGNYRNFTIYEPKPRLISALDFKDRVVQHALCNIISPIFENTLMPYTFACRVEMGTHAGVKFLQSKLRRNQFKYFLKTDYKKYFPSIDRKVLHKMIENKIACDWTLSLIREILPIEGTGIPIGNLTSQLFANVYGNLADRYIHFELGHKDWIRYMDDIIVLGNDRLWLTKSKELFGEWSESNLRLSIGKWQVSPTSTGINFLGYRIWNTHKLLRKTSVIRAKRKINKFVQSGDTEKLNKFVSSWCGHAKWANTNNLLNWMENKHGISLT